PGMREGGATVQPDVLDREKKLPPRKHFRILAPGRQEKVNGEDHKIRRHDSQRAPRVEPAEIEALTSRQRRQQLPADQVTAQDKEQIDSDPAPAVDSSRRPEPQEAGVINNDHDDGESPQEIET